MAARKSKAQSDTGRFSQDQVKQFIEQGQLKSMDDVQSALRDLFSQTLAAMLEGEMDHHLGYTHGDQENKATDNRRNGHGSKKVRSDYGDIALTVPRDREAEFEPQISRHQGVPVT